MISLILASALACAPGSPEPDPLARRELVEACARTVSVASWNRERDHGLAEAQLFAWAADSDPRVRTATYHLIASLGDASLYAAGGAILRDALSGGADTSSAERAALAALPHAVRQGMMEAHEAWDLAEAVLTRDEGPHGPAVRALGRLAPVVGDDVGPDRAMIVLDLAIDRRPEAAWGFWFRWRNELPLHEERLARLLERTVGLHPGLLRSWARESPDQLAAALALWPAHDAPGRLLACRAALLEAPEAVRRALPRVPATDHTPSPKPDIR